MNYRPLALMIGALALTPLSTIAAPPPWAGGAKASQNAAGGEQHRQYRQFNDEERRALREFGNRYRAGDLPPGLQKKVARGQSLPPGWQKKLNEGRRLPDDLYYQGYPLPDSVLRTPGGYSDVVIDNEVVRILDATQTIMEQDNILGLPALVFFTPASAEIPDSRVLGEMGPDRFIRHLEQRVMPGL